MKPQASANSHMVLQTAQPQSVSQLQQPMLKVKVTLRIEDQPLTSTLIWFAHLSQIQEFLMELLKQAQCLLTCKSGKTGDKRITSSLPIERLSIINLVNRINLFLSTL
jgi:hypothetical protein